MLQGSLRETQYDWPDRETLEAGDPSPVKPQGETIFSRDEVTYISDDVSFDGRTMLSDRLTIT